MSGGVKAVDESVETFDSFGIEPRLVRALVVGMKIQSPTLVQSACIPLALVGKDIMAKARTGSGKTLAYLIPVLHKILAAKASDPNTKATRALIVVPTRELAHQVARTAKELCQYVKDLVRTVNIATTDSNMAVLRPLLLEVPDVIITTPSRLLPFLDSEPGTDNPPLVSLKPHLESLVIDEADLLLSYGTSDTEIRTLLTFSPKHIQSYLISATLNDDVSTLKQLILRNPAILTLTEDDEPASQASTLTQYKIDIERADASATKHLILYFLIKLRVAPFGTGKTLVFVNTVDAAYKLKLFLEQFGVKSVVVNEEVPLRSRVHVVEEFNRGVFDLLIATDNGCGGSGETEDKGEDEGVEEVQEAGEAGDDEEVDNVAEGADVVEDAEEPVPEPDSSSKKRKQSAESSKKKKGKKQHNKDGEYGMARGIDFRNVSSVINFDMPVTAASYMHRVGRTARGVGKRGWALSFVTEDDFEEEIVWKRIVKRQTALGNEITTFNLDMTAVSAFKYRCNDALRSVTKPLIKEARLKELKQEILNSEKLKTHFEDNPKDLAALKHDKAVHPARVQSHMRHVPDYLMPKRGGGKVKGSGEVGANKKVPFMMEGGRKRGGGASRGRGGGRGGSSASASARRKADPLKSFKM
ncbi:P-loop containing nucleoside triphosphate hydrolase protein [Chytriomyces sp. MP71]|nr:P-loop containing nucleoside triphosphate hydrolase protein [Chytriomyces sp. MP71]